MIKTIEKYPYSTLFILVIIILLPNLDLLKVSIMEARNFITAREMLSEGNWILTTMNGAPRYEKPPLPIWITAIFGFVFGIKSVFALRFPSVIMVWLIGIYTYLFSRKLLANEMHAFVNSLIVITSFYVVGIIIEAPWDIYAHGFMLIAIYHLYQLYIQGKFINFLLTIVFIGCSIMSKGPISLYALLLPFLIAYTVVFKFKNTFLPKSILVLALGVILGGIWFYYIRIADAESFLRIASVETANWSSNHVKPIYYYWSFFIQSGIWTIPAFVSLLYPYLKNRVSNKQAYRLSFLWTIFAVVLLSLVPEKKSRYLMPVLIPLAINTGFYIQYIISEFKNLKNKTEKILANIVFGIFGVLGLLTPLVVYLFFYDAANQQLHVFLPASLALLFMSCFSLFNLYLKNILSVFYLNVFIYAVIMLVVIPFNPGFTNQNKNYTSIESLKSEAQNENIKVYVLDNISPEMLWYYGGIIPIIPWNKDGIEWPDEDKFGMLIADPKLVSRKSLNKEFVIEYKETFDINTDKINARSYKPRKVRHYYIFHKRKVR